MSANKTEETIYSWTNRPTIKPEKNLGKRITKSSGYIPIAVQVMNFREAGINLEKMRGKMYDYEEGKIGGDVTDPTRHPGWDMADAHDAFRKAQKRLQSEMRERYLQKKNAQKTPPEASAVSMGDTINERERIASDTPSEQPEGKK